MFDFDVSPQKSGRIFSGIQPTGGLHLGNYLGAIKNFVRLQHDYECVYCIVDLHAITVPQDPSKMKDQTREIAAAFLASGIDPNSAIMFNQSQVRAHAELGWVFNCIARMGWLNRMTQFKDKAGKNKEKVSVGLYDYPVLQAADILVYRATHVPVGEDQRQHLELCRDIAAKFNNDYNNEYFPLIDAIIPPDVGRIMSLRDGKKKMSKSDPSEYSRITMMDDADTIAQKVRKATTDPHALPSTDVLDEHGAVSDEAQNERPEVFNLLGIYAALSDQSLKDTILEHEGSSFAGFKGKLTELAVEKLGPIGSEMQRWMNDPASIDAVLAKGAEQARRIADPVVDDVYDILGLLRANP